MTAARAGLIGPGHARDAPRRLHHARPWHHSRGPRGVLTALYTRSRPAPYPLFDDNELETHLEVDFSGVILLSQILNFDDMTGLASFEPGIDLPSLRQVHDHIAAFIPATHQQR